MADLEHAMANGRAWYDEIKTLLEQLDCDDTALEDAANEQIQGGPLSVMVRAGWHQPGAGPAYDPEEYEILLSTGGPALRIWGTLTDGEPDTAELQAQDWGTPWTRVPDCEEDVLLAYAQQFYFGE